MPTGDRVKMTHIFARVSLLPVRAHGHARTGKNKPTRKGCDQRLEAENPSLEATLTRPKRNHGAIATSECIFGFGVADWADWPVLGLVGRAAHLAGRR